MEQCDPRLESHRNSAGCQCKEEGLVLHDSLSRIPPELAQRRGTPNKEIVRHVHACCCCITSATAAIAAAVASLLLLLLPLDAAAAVAIASLLLPLLPLDAAAAAVAVSLSLAL